MKLKSYKIRLYPNKIQAEYFSKTFGCGRFLYNYFLNSKIEYYKQTKKLKGFKFDSEKELKKQYEWLKEFDNPKVLKKYEDKLKEEQKKVNRKAKGSNNRNKQIL